MGGGDHADNNPGGGVNNPDAENYLLSNIRNRGDRWRVLKYIADISKAKQKLDYFPQTSIYQGLEKSVKWYYENIE